MIILASQSQARRDLLHRAGVDFKVVPSDFDEDAAKRDYQGAELAVFLSQGKAMDVSRRHPEAIVIGADQTLFCEGRFFDKPGTAGRAREQLLALRGKSHTLTSAASCASKGAIVWTHSETAVITFRDFSDETLEHYLRDSGEAILHSVGAYHYEGAGIRLMEKVEGSDHTILGLPVLPLLAYLRSRRLLPT